MICADVMTRNVLSVAPDSSVEDAASLMLERGVSGLFVVDAKGDLAGVVTEGDLLRRHEIGTGHERPGWLSLLLSPGRQAADFTRTYGRKVSDVMTGTVVSIAHDADLAKVVELMEEHRIKRVPVTQDGRVIGVVSRSDLLRALVSHAATPDAVVADDETIHAAVMDALNQQGWAPRATLNVTVAQGVVTLAGAITNDDERRAICVVAENTAGVKEVDDQMVFVEPYTGTVIEAPAAKP